MVFKIQHGECKLMAKWFVQFFDLTVKVYDECWPLSATGRNVSILKFDFDDVMKRHFSFLVSSSLLYILTGLTWFNCCHSRNTGCSKKFRLLIASRKLSRRGRFMSFMQKRVEASAPTNFPTRVGLTCQALKK